MLYEKSHVLRHVSSYNNFTQMSKTSDAAAAEPKKSDLLKGPILLGQMPRMNVVDRCLVVDIKLNRRFASSTASLPLPQSRVCLECCLQTLTLHQTLRLESP